MGSNIDLEQYYESYGEGCPMVMIHGSYATTSTWKRMLPLIPKGHRCILIKLPGHGGALQPNDFDCAMVETELSIIEAIIAKECKEPIHLVGHSYGGVVALALALKKHVRISKLSLFEPVATWVLELENDRPMMKVVDDFLHDYLSSVEKNQDEACSKVIDFWSGRSEFAHFPDKVKKMMATLVKNNVRHWDICTTFPEEGFDLMSMNVPTDIVFGSQSNAVAHAIAGHLNNLLPNTRCTQIKGASHGLVGSHPSDCVEAMF